MDFRMAEKRPSSIFLPGYRIPKKARQEFNDHFDDVQQEEEERERREREEREKEEWERKRKGQQIRRCTINAKKGAPHSQFACDGWHTVGAASDEKLAFLSGMAAEKTKEERDREMDLAIKNAQEELDLLERDIQATQAFTRAERARIGDMERVREREAHEYALYGTYAYR